MSKEEIIARIAEIDRARDRINSNGFKDNGRIYLPAMFEYSDHKTNIYHGEIILDRGLIMTALLVEKECLEQQLKDILKEVYEV